MPDPEPHLAFHCSAGDDIGLMLRYHFGRTVACGLAEGHPTAWQRDCRKKLRYCTFLYLEAKTLEGIFFRSFFFFFLVLFFFWPSRPVIYTRCRLNVSPRCGAASHFPHSLGSL